jgi:3-deoxy-D-manno-octulosonic-acid transferase
VTPIPLALYGVATGVLEPVLLPAILAARARRGKEDPARIGERQGRSSRARPDKPLVWLHGVSVGESLSLLPLVTALAARRPDLALLVTCGTVTAAELLARRLPEGVIHQYAPADGPAAVARFLDHWRPAAGVIFASELWPNLIPAAQARGVRLALVSARVTERSARGWGRAPATARRLLRAFEVVLPQDAASAARLTALGAEVGPRLDLKLAGEAPPCDPEALAQMRAAIGGRKAVLAVSTHPGEEAIIAQAFRAAGIDALLIVQPRHPERGAAVADLLAAEGFAVARRGGGAAPEAGVTAYVADTLGETGLFLRLADVAVMGGSFVTGVGGHNPMEPARLGKPILTGPHVFNARDLYDALMAEGAAIEAADGAALARDLKGLFDYPAIARRTGEAAGAFAARQGAALETALALIEPLAPA